MVYRMSYIALKKRYTKYCIRYTAERGEVAELADTEPEQSEGEGALTSMRAKAAVRNAPVSLGSASRNL